MVFIRVSAAVLYTKMRDTTRVYFESEMATNFTECFYVTFKTELTEIMRL